MPAPVEVMQAELDRTREQGLHQIQMDTGAGSPAQGPAGESSGAAGDAVDAPGSGTDASGGAVAGQSA